MLQIVALATVNAQTFTEVALSKGVTHLYAANGFLGGGVSFVDFDGDGWDDLSFTSSQGYPLHIFRNVQGVFFPILPMGISNSDENKCLLWVDYDNDGDKDLFVTANLGISKLYRNNGDLTFTDITGATGLSTDLDPTFGATFTDFNNDGWLDLYVANRALEHEFPSCNHLYINQTDGTFLEITQQAGVADSLKGPLLTGAFDVDMNGFQDLFVPQDKFYGNTLFKNNGNLTFTDVSQASGADYEMDAMSFAVGDFDNDHDLDVYITNTLQSNVLMENQGSWQFENKANVHGLGFFGMSWGANFFDFDNDLDLDLYVSGENHGGINTGLSKLFINENFGFNQNNVLPMSGNNLRSYGNAVGDFNNDGFYDIVVLNAFFGHSHLWQNSGGDQNWVKIDLRGVISNRDAIGCLLEFYVDGVKYIRSTHSSISYNSQNSNTIIFGMGTHPVLDSLIVHWPSGIITKHYELPAGSRNLLVEDFITGTQSESLMVKVWPNPVSEMLFIAHDRADYLQLFDASGKIVFTQNVAGQSNQIQVNMESFPAGIYLLRVVKVGGGISTTRVLR
jgi:hypothetical protein